MNGRSSLGLVVGYHGCDRETVAEPVLLGEKSLIVSENPYDWLGFGAYFWENDYDRAMKWAEDRVGSGGGRTKVVEPYVVGAVIDLGNCLDLVRLSAQELVSEAHQLMEDSYQKAGLPVPENTGGRDHTYRKLDCAVIQFLHVQRSKRALSQFDTVRGMFQEGAQPYEGAGFRLGNHVQIAVRSPSSIIGYFRPRELTL